MSTSNPLPPNHPNQNGIQLTRRILIGGVACLGIGSVALGGGWYLRLLHQEARQAGAFYLDQQRLTDALGQYRWAQRNPWNWISSTPVAGADVDWLQQQIQTLQQEVADLREAISASADPMAKLITLGEYLAQLGDPVGAEAAFRQSLALDATQSRTHFGLGQLLEQHGQPAAALEHYQTAAERVPDNALFQTALARIQIATDNPEAGIQRLEAVLEQDPYRPDTLHALSVAYTQQQRWDLALQHGIEAKMVGSALPFEHLDPVVQSLSGQTSSPQAQLQLGQAHFLQGHYRHAEAAFQTAIGLDPTLAEAHLGLGWALIEQQRNAIPELTQALDLKSDPPYHHALGVALWRSAQSQGDPLQPALVSLQEAVDQNPQHPRYRRDLGLALAQSGQWQRSLATLESTSNRWQQDPTVQRVVDIAQAQTQVPPAESDQTEPGSTGAGPSPAQITVDLNRLRPNPSGDSPSFDWSMMQALLLWGSGVGVLVGLVWWGMTRHAGGATIWPGGANFSAGALSSKPTPATRKAGTVQAYQQALGLTEQGRWAEAIPLLEQVVAQKPDYGPAYLLLGQAYRHQGQLTAAIQSYQTAHQLQPQTAVVPLYETLKQEGERRLQQQDPQGAIEHLQQAKHLAADESISDAERADLKLRLGEAYLADKAWQAATEQFRAVIDLDPDLALAHCYLADVFFQRNEIERATDTYWLALEKDPDLVKAHHGLALALIRQGNLASGLASLQTAVALSATPSLDLRLDLALASVLAGTIDSAEKLIEQALIQDPEHPRAYFAKGNLLFSQLLYQEAIDTYQKALDLDSELWAALAAQGLAILEQSKEKFEDGKRVLQSRQVEAAIAKFETVLQKDPNVVEAHYGIGEVHRMRSHLQFALKAYQVGLKANASYAPIHYQLGRLYVRWNRYELAVESLRSALQLNPHFSKAQELLERVYQKQAEILKAKTRSGQAKASRSVRPAISPMTATAPIPVGPSVQRMFQAQAQSTWDPEQAKAMAEQHLQSMADVLDYISDAELDTPTDITTEIITSEASEADDGIQLPDAI